MFVGEENSSQSEECGVFKPEIVSAVPEFTESCRFAIHGFDVFLRLLLR